VIAWLRPGEDQLFDRADITGEPGENVTELVFLEERHREPCRCEYRDRS